MNRTWCVTMAAVGLILTGCQVDHAGADPATFSLNQDFDLGGGQETSIDGDGLRVRFTDVLEDSRCPVRVECFWTGQARLSIQVQPTGDTPSTLQFNTNPAPGQTLSTGRVGAYTVELKALSPYPQTPDDATPLEDYRVTLVVSRD